ncbi:MAG: hypothetical protein ACLQBL_18195 [Polyangiaceae bacterium]|jgi:hypothetical protein
MRIRGRLAWLALTSLGAAAIAVACSTGANDVSACQSIETARCQVAPSCPGNFNLQSPTPDGDPVTACIRFYQDQCRHGLVTSVQPSNSQVGSCVTAILNAGKAANAAHDVGDDAAVPCNLITEPQNYPACTFLNPVDAGEDAGPCTGSAGCVGSTSGVDCCATVVLEDEADGGATFPTCGGASSISSYCGICLSIAPGPSCTATETFHLCALASDCASETTNTLCCQLNGYQACVSSATVTAGALTCL